MPNTSQLFSGVPHISGVASGLGGNTALDGTGTVALLFTAQAAGSRVERIVAIHLGTNIASMIRLFENNGGAPTTGSNNSLIEELAMPANTLVHNAISAPGIFLRVPIILPPSHRLYIAVPTAVASGYQVTAFGGDY